MIGGQSVYARRPSDAATKSIPQDAVCALCGEPIFKEECSQGVHIYCQRCGFRDSVAHVHCVPRSMLAKNTPWWKWLFHRGHAEGKKSPNGRRGVIVPGCDACTVEYMTDEQIDKVFIRHVEYLLGTRENLRGLLQGKPSAHVLKQLDVNRRAEQSLEHGIDDFVTRAHSEGRKIGNTFGKEEREIVERYDLSPQMPEEQYNTAWAARHMVVMLDDVREEVNDTLKEITMTDAQTPQSPGQRVEEAHLRQKIVEEIKAANPEQVESLRKELKILHEEMQMREPTATERSNVVQLTRHILIVHGALGQICSLLGIDHELPDRIAERDQDGEKLLPFETLDKRLRRCFQGLHEYLEECTSMQRLIIQELEALHEVFDRELS